MRLSKALFLASIPRTIASPLASDRSTPYFSVFSTTDLDNQDWNVRPLAGSSFVATVDGSPGSPDSEKYSLNNFGLDNQNDLNFGSTPNSITTNTDISKMECSSGTAQASNTLQAQVQCFPSTADENSFAEEDAADAVWVENYRKTHPKEDENEERKKRKYCGADPGLQNTPLCCRDPPIVLGLPPEFTVVYDFCVEFILGRPRCLSSRWWKCCSLLGLGSGSSFPTRGVDCRDMDLDALGGLVG